MEWHQRGSVTNEATASSSNFWSISFQVYYSTMTINWICYPELCVIKNCSQTNDTSHFFPAFHNIRRCSTPNSNVLSSRDSTVLLYTILLCVEMLQVTTVHLSPVCRWVVNSCWLYHQPATVSIPMNRLVSIVTSRLL